MINSKLCDAAHLIVEVFILELVSIDALSSRTVLIGEISSLHHELLDDWNNKKKTKQKAWAIQFRRKMKGLFLSNIS